MLSHHLSITQYSMLEGGEVKWSLLSYFNHIRTYAIFDTSFGKHLEMLDVHSGNPKLKAGGISHCRGKGRHTTNNTMWKMQWCKYAYHACMHRGRVLLWIQNCAGRPPVGSDIYWFLQEKITKTTCDGKEVPGKKYTQAHDAKGWCFEGIFSISFLLGHTAWETG